ncbi:hypothetical protein TRAPUB_1083 [Trametes pubescens]|uniref:Uncharacterized protein n=1 Tax=Trametes pubescens TaxID=154538 RepID=A0A1M2VK98_TRAPU|nr:hypothetical protein TRAPUB_1083 [Trametes pubescens]
MPPRSLPTLPHLACALLLALLLLGSVPSAARRVNYTIDDEIGDSNSGVVPTYAPADAWTQGATADIDPLQAFQGTWHAATYDPDDTETRTVTATFEGSAVYVYHILANAASATAGSAGLAFYLDDDLVGTFAYVSDGEEDVQYNVPVYSNTSVPHGSHTLRVETSGPATPDVLFDYIVYTARDGSGGHGHGWHGSGDRDGDDSDGDPASTSTSTSTSNSTSSSSPSDSSSTPSSTSDGTDDNDDDGSSSASSTSATPTSESDTDDGSSRGFRGGNGDGGGHHGSHGSTTAGVIVGGTIGGLALLAIIVGTIIYFHRRSRRARPPAADDDDEKQLRAAGSGNDGLGAASVHLHHPRPSVSGTTTEMSVHAPPPGLPSQSVPHIIPAAGYNQGHFAEADVLSDPSSPSAPAETPVSASIIVRPPASASVKRIQRQAEIAYQIRLLEAQMQVLQADPVDDPSVDAGATPPAADTAHDSALQAEVQVLRDEVASLRTRWELEQRITTEFTASEAPPRYSRGS